MATSLGMQGFVGTVSTVVLWFMAGPAVMIFAVRRGGGIDAAWTTFLPAYVILNVVTMYRLTVFDWEDYSQQVKERENNTETSGVGQDFDGGPMVANGAATPLV